MKRPVISRLERGLLARLIRAHVHFPNQFPGAYTHSSNAQKNRNPNLGNRVLRYSGDGNMCEGGDPNRGGRVSSLSSDKMSIVVLKCNNNMNGDSL
jgi:hypothetical protein